MGNMAGNIVVFLLMFLCCAFVVGLTMVFLRLWLKQLVMGKIIRPTSRVYLIFNKTLWKVPVWLIASLVLSIVMWIRWLSDVE